MAACKRGVVAVAWLACAATAGVPEAQRADPTAQREQRAAARERDPAGQTARVQQGYI